MVWGPGDDLLGTGTVVQVLLGAVQRECLLIASLAGIVALHISTRARPIRPAPDVPVRPVAVAEQPALVG
ncbi:MAG: hypothetical protein U0S36_02895 [Candidatus Nanopelagicales bacterium]